MPQQKLVNGVLEHRHRLLGLGLFSFTRKPQAREMNGVLMGGARMSDRRSWVAAHFRSKFRPSKGQQVALPMSEKRVEYVQAYEHCLSRGNRAAMRCHGLTRKRSRWSSAPREALCLGCAGAREHRCRTPL